MKKLTLFFLSLMLLFVTLGQIPSNYYANAKGKKQKELKTALFEIIKGHETRTYTQLWSDFYTTDVRFDGKVWDMYSNCNFTFGSSQCGNYNSLCDCYNREHSVPKSWFNDQSPMYTDLFHLYPTDGWTNGKRSNFPFGEVGSATWTGNNGSKLGSSSFSGYSGTVFEPDDEYKGDFARTYLYMATRYLNVNFTHEQGGAITFTYNNSICELTNYAINLFLEWHRNDPVSEKEIDRNNAVYGFQNNRNPYIDYPELAEHIWGNLQHLAWQSENNINENHVSSFIKITKQHNGINIEGVTHNAKVEIFNIMGQNIYTELLNQNFISLNHLQRGVYIIKIDNYIEKIVW